LAEARTSVKVGWLAANRAAVKFVVGFGVWIAVFSVLLVIPWFEATVVVPMTEMIANVSATLIRLLGFDVSVSGTIISGVEGFSVNILKGCNGAYVIAIYLSAVLAFPSTWRQKAVGALVGIPAVQTINLGRIVSLYYVGLEHPSLFERFHYHVWQTVVIVLSMVVWIVWAEICLRRAGR